MARSYPFLDPQIGDRLPDIMDMPGATIEAPLDNLHLDPTKTLSNLLNTMHADQLAQTARAQYPVGRVAESLPPDDALCLQQEVFGRQAFNYNPVITPDPKAPLQNIQFAGPANTSIMWWCGMVDAETVQMRSTWNDEVLGQKDAAMAMDGFEKNLKWIVDGGNWEKEVGECGR
ncbi:MAG: hypothetical protein Q9198_002753 [Flavoplaca austrocitrina]